MSCEEAPHPYLEAPHPCPVLCHDDTTLEKPFWRAAEHTCVDVSGSYPPPRIRHGATGACSTFPTHAPGSLVVVHMPGRK